MIAINYVICIFIHRKGKKKKKPLCTPSIYIGHFKQNSESEDRPSKVKASIVCPLAPALV